MVSAIIVRARFGRVGIHNPLDPVIGSRDRMKLDRHCGWAEATRTTQVVSAGQVKTTDRNIGWEQMRRIRWPRNRCAI